MGKTKGLNYTATGPRFPLVHNARITWPSALLKFTKELRDRPLKRFQNKFNIVFCKENRINLLKLTVCPL